MAGDLVLQALAHAWASLAALRVPAALMGGLALAAWKHVRSTQDVHLLVGCEGNQLVSTLPSLVERGFRLKYDPALRGLGALRMVALLYEPQESYIDLEVDLLLAEAPNQRTALAQAVPMRLQGANLDLLVLACEDLVLHKLMAGRIIDRADAVALIRGNYGALDRPYLAQWAHHLGLAADLAAACRVAGADRLSPTMHAP
jgi:hypothetical protein